MNDYESYEKKFDRFLIVLGVALFLSIGGFIACTSAMMPTLAESIARCRTSCEANNMLMRGYSTGKYGGCSCEVKP